MTDWNEVIKNNRESHRRAIEQHSKPCPECGVCNPDAKTHCIHKTCPFQSRK